MFPSVPLNRKLTCRLLRGVSSHEAAIGHRCISAEHNSHCVARRANLGAGWYCTTESVQAWRTVHQPIQYLRDREAVTEKLWYWRSKIPTINVYQTAKRTISKSKTVIV